MVHTYDIFDGEELKIAELIQRRRCQMIVHSYIYYELDSNVISDHDWMEWANELRDLQQQYPEIEKRVPYREGFEDWDGSTGAFIPFEKYPGLVAKAYQLCGAKPKVEQPKPKPAPETKPAKKSAPTAKRLF